MLLFQLIYKHNYDFIFILIMISGYSSYLNWRVRGTYIWMSMQVCVVCVVCVCIGMRSHVDRAVPIG